MLRYFLSLALVAVMVMMGCGKVSSTTTSYEGSKMSKKKATSAAPAASANPQVLLKTSLGDITVELFAKESPISTANFLEYVNSKFYDGTIFHRVIPGFMIQCGGMDKDMQEKSNKRAPIKNEADNGLKNRRGTLAMARTMEVNSATSQFFINLKDNEFLDNGYRDFGYAVFGKVTSGMEVVDKIAQVPTGSHGFHQDVPRTTITIESATEIK